MFPLNTNKMSFEKTIFLKGIPNNMFAALIIFLYSSYFIGMNAKQMLFSGLFVIVMVLISQLCLAPVTNVFFSRKLSQKLQNWENSDTTIDERTELVKEVMSFPKIKGLETIGYFVVCAFFLFIANSYLAKVDLKTNGMSLFLCFFGAYNAHMLAINFSEKICSEYAKKIIDQGIDENEVYKTKIFNFSLNHLFIMYCVVPILFTASIAIAVMIKGYIYSPLTQMMPTFNEQILRLLVISFVNISLSIILSYLFFSSIKKNTETISASLLKIISTDIQKEEKLHTDLSNELSFNVFLMNQTISFFHTIIDKTNDIASLILKSTEELVVVSNENSSTSMEQVSGVREMVSAMEDSDQLTKNIANKVLEVTEAAKHTAVDVGEGVDILSINLNKMQEITESNIATTSGIKALSEQIESIWEIVSIINNIADQTKIIAFNAELEAASAGEAGKNFHIVANEIRRLADGTKESTSEIKQRIHDIQHSSDRLIITSEGGTGKIQEGCELSTKLEKSFNNIKDSSEITADTAGEIKLIIEQQTSAYDQILITLKQISAGIENFSSSTKSVNDSSVQLKLIADKLTAITYN